MDLLSLRPTWPTDQVVGQPRLHRQTQFGGGGVGERENGNSIIASDFPAYLADMGLSNRDDG